MEEQIGLKNIRIAGLFGRRQHVINLDQGQPTVLTGANGTGKSTILRLVNAVYTGDVKTLAAAPLREFELTFTIGPSFRLLKESQGRVKLSWGQHESVLEYAAALDDLPDWAADALREAGSWDEEDVERLLMEAARPRVPYSTFLTVRDKVRGLDSASMIEAPEWFSDMAGTISVLYVTDQRLVVEPAVTKDRRTVAGAHRRSSRLAVEVASRDIAEQMRTRDSAYARASQLQDRQFPREVIAAMGRREVIPLDEVTQLLSDVDRRRERLREVGLLDSDQRYEPELPAEGLAQETVRPVIATFLRATLVKLDVLTELESRLRAFKDFLDGRFVGKSMRLSRQDGVKFVLDGFRTISPSQLSSGEQQMMVLAYEILFRATPGTLVIVDEPEISLHVLWQDTLINNLTAMGEAAGLQFLMATHSPVLLGSHPELERSLDPVR